MEPSRFRFKYELVLLVGMLLIGGVVYLIRVVGNPFASASLPPPPRQSVPPPAALELPPVAPVPSESHPFFSRMTPSEPPENEQKLHQAEKRLKRRSPKIPSRWEIIKAYRQVFELDLKYIQIAVLSDRYGYKNQAIVYYEKYLSVAPTGPYANQVRQRLSQLESSP